MTNWRDIRAAIESKDVFYVLAISGGVDSMVLLDFFSRSKCQFAVTHFNHQLQESNTAMQELVEKYCVDHDIMVDTGYGYDIEANAKMFGIGIEAEARKQRYEYIESMAIGYERLYNKPVLVVTGHHQNDQVETVLLNLIRGTSLDRTFIKEVDERRYRPFLKINKLELINQATSRHLEWIEDPTNVDTDADRNWLRNEVIPLLKTRRNIDKTIPLSIEKFLASQY